MDGAETQIYWMRRNRAPAAGPARRCHRARRGAIYWDNFSETTPDVKTLELDFEGYRVLRADNWDRAARDARCDNGPPANLWKLLFEDGRRERLRRRHRARSRTATNHSRTVLTPASKRDMIEPDRSSSSSSSRAPDPPVPAGRHTSGVRHAGRSRPVELGVRSAAGSTTGTWTAPFTSGARTSTR